MMHKKIRVCNEIAKHGVKRKIDYDSTLSNHLAKNGHLISNIFLAMKGMNGHANQIFFKNGYALIGLQKTSVDFK